jgi:thioredoxin-related protein
MRLSLYLIILLLLFPSVLFASEPSNQSLSAGMVNPGYHEKPAWFKESFLDIREDIAEAESAGKRVLLYFYQDGCPYCGKLLQDNFGDVKIADYTRQQFDVIAINMWGDREVTDLTGGHSTEKAFAKSLKVQFTPTLVFLDEAGKVVLRVNGYFAPHKFMTALQYVAEKKESVISARDYFQQQQPQQATGRLHEETSNLAKTADGFDLQRKIGGKPLMVIFGQKTCSACDELHQDILKRDKVADSMKPFDIVVIDSWSEEELVSPEGQKLSAREWAKKLGIHYNPSLVFFDTAGKEVFRTEGYLRSFHVKGAMDYVASSAYLQEPEFQRYLQKVTEDLHAKGIEYNLMD